MFVVSMLMFAAAASDVATAKPAKDPERVRCVREVETGSLVKARKICHTEREWQALHDNARRDSESMMNSAPGYGGN